jgi:hypothetical protein
MYVRLRSDGSQTKTLFIYLNERTTSPAGSGGRGEAKHTLFLSPSLLENHHLLFIKPSLLIQNLTHDNFSFLLGFQFRFNRLIELQWRGDPLVCGFLSARVCGWGPRTGTKSTKSVIYIIE